MSDMSGGNRLPQGLVRACGSLVLWLWAAAALAGGTYYTNSDNAGAGGSGVPDNDMDVTVSEGGQIEFNINVVDPPTSTAVLTIYARDVDEEQGEVDDVFLNGTHIGRLSGANDVWSSTVFHLNPALLVPGNNLVRVDVSTGGGGWVVTVDWGQMLIDGGAADRGDTGTVAITGYSIAGGTVTVNTSTNVRSISGGQYRLEMSIVAPNGDSASVLTQTFTADPNEDVVRTASPTYALGSVSGIYSVQAQLFYMDNGFPVQQDVATTQFVHTQNVGITDADNDGLTETQENTLGTNRFSADTDGDGEDDPTEVGGNVNAPLNADGDAFIDALDSSILDSDNDGVDNEADSANTNPCIPSASHAQCLGADSDGDGLTNAQEDALGANRNAADSDGDGVNDGIEVGNVNSPTDTDGDGSINALESSSIDSDGDGFANQVDPANSDACSPNSASAPCMLLDSDSDGLTNGEESTLGTDRTATDTDGDGEDDAIEAGGNPTSPLDTDGDGIIDALESSIDDLDGDGVANESDPANSNSCVPNANSTACLALDSDGDGVTNGAEDALGTSRSTADTDGDGVTDGVEVGNANAPLDSDGDGLIDALESSVADTDGDGTPNQTDAYNTNPCLPNGNAAACLATDSDGDGLTNAAEDSLGTDRNSTDSDGDGIDDGVEVDGDPLNPADVDGDGVPDAIESAIRDEDGDGVVDSVDTDSDNDGIPDSVEAPDGLPRDTDGDGIPDYLDRDSDNDSLPDAMEAGQDAAPRDSDNDGTPDYLDRDSDGDGVADRLEASGDGIDSDHDGIDDAFDADTRGEPDANGDGLADSTALRDTDGDGLPDAIDSDSDGDGVVDGFEAGIAGHDSDNDGIDDAADVDSTHGVDSDGDGIDDAFHLLDSDSDGTPDLFDLDSDNDGRSDVVEAGLVDLDHDGRADNPASSGAPRDSDGDGVPDQLDLDADGDGVFDIVATGLTDADSDGRIDGTLDSDGDGIPDVADAAPNVPGTYADADGDGVADAIDLDLDNDGIPDAVEGTADADGDGIPNLADGDSDNDGIPDLVEAGGVDVNGDGIVDDLTDTNGNGLADFHEPQAGGGALPMTDTDGDGFLNYVDVDSDSDGIFDLVEAGGVDANNDGRVDAFVDANRNGLADAFDGGLPGAVKLNRADSDGDGVIDMLDLDSDGDGFSDSQERLADSDGDGTPDYRDSSGKLDTAVRGAGAIDPLWLLAAAALLLLRRRPSGALLMMPLVVCCGLLLGAQSAEAQSDSTATVRLALDGGLTALKPEANDGGYRVDDDTSEGWRFSAAYSWSRHWSAEAFYVDAGEAGIASDNADIGHLGGIEYQIYGAGLRWAPLEEGEQARWYPSLALGVSTISTDVTDSRIAHERQNSLSIYAGAGLAWRWSERLTLRVDFTSYDKDAQFLSLGVGWKL